MADPAGAVRLLLFRIGGLDCALPVEMVREVLPVQPATRIPGAPPAVEGLVNVRGTLLTVVDGPRLLDRPGARGEESSLLVLRLGGRAVGLQVDQVLDLVAMPEAALEPQGSLPGVDRRLLRAVGRHDARVFIVLDTDALLAPVLA
ncbi:MAG TPA: chemotaxis protein CheW [Gemmatimonadales bacterium]|nr:chemotaxis protein CheW [Gemmatimonadales bacterium]